MSEVDRLRTEEEVLSHEAALAERRRDVADRLRAAYVAQGTPVGEDTLQTGIAAYFDRRLRHIPPPDGPGAFVAAVWIQRKPILAIAAAAAIVIGALGGIAHELVVFQRAHRQAEIEQARAAETEAAQALTAAEQAAERAIADARSAAKDPAAGPELEELSGRLTSAVAAKDVASIRTVTGQAEQLLSTLRAAYDVRIVNRPGEFSRLWFYSTNNREERWYYVVVEAVDSQGHPVALPIRGENGGESRDVSVWGERVDKAFYDRIGAEKQEGTLHDVIFARKLPGFLAIKYSLGPKADGALSQEAGRVNAWPHQ